MMRRANKRLVLREVRLNTYTSYPYTFGLAFGRDSYLSFQTFFFWQNLPSRLLGLDNTKPHSFCVVLGCFREFVGCVETDSSTFPKVRD